MERDGSFSDIIDDPLSPIKEHNDGMGMEDGEGEDDEFEITGDHGDEADARFDECVGALEDIVISEGFIDKQNEFLRRNCSAFEDSEENKLIYTQIFAEYQSFIEEHVEKRLIAMVPGFSMEDFLGQLEERHEELAEELLEMLLSCADFSSFKQLMLETKAVASTSGSAMGGVGGPARATSASSTSASAASSSSSSAVSSSSRAAATTTGTAARVSSSSGNRPKPVSLSVVGAACSVIADEETEGVHVPDLDNALTISPIGSKKQQQAKMPWR